jgi:predicted transcriptional regulator
MTVRLDSALLARLTEAAANENEPLSTLARRAIVDWLERRGPRRATTLLNAAGSTSGSGRSATNANVRAAFRKRRA